MLVPFFDAKMFDWLPYLAAGAMAMSSVTVVSNSLLLGRYRPRFASTKLRTEIPSDNKPRQVYTEIRSKS